MIRSEIGSRYARRASRKSDIARVPELVATTLDRLSTQAALYARGDAKEPYIARNITATSFSHRSADISVTLDKVADPSPELLATLARNW
jgi:hypothetical protein